MAYSEKVLDHYNNPRNVGKMDPKDPMVGTGMVGAPACGDVMRLQIKIEEGVCTNAVFKTYGCGSAIASSSLFVDMMMGLTIDEAKLIRDKDIADVLQLPPIKLHCSVLAEDAIRQAMVDYETKQTDDYTHPILDTAKIGHNNPPQ